MMCSYGVYDFFKDFAQPLATGSAGIAAAGITAFFARRQANTAQQQADIAHDKLRFDLFEKRYAIYNAARQAIDIAFKKRYEDKNPPELRGLFITFEEARFFFPEEIYQSLNKIRKLITEFLQHSFTHRNSMLPSNEAARREATLEEEQTILNLEQTLYEMQMNLPKVFNDVLSFPQLTGSSAHRSKNG